MMKKNIDSREPRRAYYLTPIVLMLVVFVNLYRDNSIPNKDTKESPFLIGYSNDDNEKEVSLNMSDESQIKDENNYLMLEDKELGLDSEYLLSDLRLVDVMDSGNNANTTIYLRDRAATMVENMFMAAKAEGLLLLVCNGYRSGEIQQNGYQNYIEEDKKEGSKEYGILADYSEYQTGLALDIMSNSMLKESDLEFLNTPEGVWIKENAHRFGFVFRSPEGPGDIYATNHLRYVGVSIATIIHQNNWTFEAYFENQ